MTTEKDGYQKDQSGAQHHRSVVSIRSRSAWYKASVVVVRPSGGEDKDGWESAQITVSHEATGEFDPFATGIAQSKWNKWAATVAAVAAFVQGIVLLFPD